MCAINGFSFEDRGLLNAMNAVTAHRGPDGTAVLVEEGISLGHNRLAIIDLSPNAGQPMTDRSGRYSIVFNGQIYNFKELKAELSSYPFRTRGDTEVLLAAYARWGEGCLDKLRGMFAFAIWDRQKQELFLARDHAGIKPLYYVNYQGKLIFSSEIKGILQHPLPRRLNYLSFGRYMRALYVPGPETMIEGILKLPAGSYGVFKQGELSIKRYWEARSVSPEKRKSVEWQEDIRREIDASVSAELLSDRPLGVYLSGGIDSSIVLDAVSRVRESVDTFSVGFELGEGEQADRFNADFDIARRTAALYGSKHHEVLLSAKEAAELLPRAIWHLDQPISNATILPMMKLAAFAKERATVVLGGDGGDELFGGYERYRLSHAASLYQKVLPASLRGLFSFSPRLKKLNTPAGAERYALFMFEKERPLARVLKTPFENSDILPFFGGKLDVHAYPDFESLFMDTDRETWLRDESLSMTDAMSMSAGLEARVPLLSRGMIKLAARLPLCEKVSLSQTKIALKAAFRGRLPEYLFREPKRGWFSPGAKWLRAEAFGPLLSEVFSPSYYAPTTEIFNWQEVKAMLLEHQEKRGYHYNTLWAILVFQMWARRYAITLD